MDSQTLVTIQQFNAAIPENYQVLDIILFGSRARDTHQQDSDVDVAVILKGDAGDFMTVKRVQTDVAFDVMLETGLRISAWPTWEYEWANPAGYSNPELLENMQREGLHCLRLVGKDNET